MKKKYIYAFAALFTMGVSSCEMLGDFDDTNQNPSAATEPIASALLVNAQAQLGSYASNTRGGLYAQYFSETQYTDASLYSLPQLAFTGEYSGILMDLQDIINRQQSNNMTQVATIMQQYVFWTITDRWGDVPYSEALTTGITTPKYDTQEDIYKGMLAKLTTAVASFDNASSISGDVIYGGDVASWKRAANSLRMLMAIRLSERFPSASGYAATEFKAALNDPAGYISSNAQNFEVDYPGGNFKSNWFQLYNGRKDFAESATMVNILADLGDTRQNAFGGATQDQGQANSFTSSNVGVPYGVPRAQAEAFTSANPNWARVLRGDFRTEGGSVVIVSAAQVALARAEAADYGWTSEDLQSVYAKGIQLSYEQWNATMPGSYLTQANVALSAPAGTGANLKQIATQRYIASYPDGLQAWSIWRKTGFPVLTPTPFATNASKQIPRRYVYATGEYTSNKANVEAAVARIGADNQDTRVWWDVQ